MAKRKSRTKQHITLTSFQINKMKKDVTNDAVGKAMILFLTALRDEYGFGESRLRKVFDRANRYAEHIDNHLITLKETQTILEKSTGIKISGF